MKQARKDKMFILKKIDGEKKNTKNFERIGKIFREGKKITEKL